MLLYKYRGLSDVVQFEQLREILSTGKLWFPNGTEVNDPFEFRCVVGLTWDLEKTAELFALVEMHVNSTSSFPEALEKARTVLGRVSRRRLQERQWELSYDMWKTWAQGVTICCLAGNAISSLMWSHYANNHMGVAIEVEVPDEQYGSGLFADVHKVEYSDELPKINPLSLIDMKIGAKERLFETLFLRKAKCWEYEHEYRILRGNCCGGPIASHLGQLPRGCTIVRVIVGCAMSAESRERLQEMIFACAPHVGIAYVLPSEDNYKLSVVDASDLDA